MKTKLLIILIITAVSIVTTVSFSIYSDDDFPNRIVSCGDDFIQRGDSCYLDPRLIKPNTIILYAVTDQGGTRLNIAPHSLIINLEKNDTVTWINQGIFTATVNDVEKSKWATGKIKPSMQKSIQFNSTGFYPYAVVAGDGEMGDIIVLSDNTNSLPVDIRSKMAQSIVSGDLDNNPALIGVGSGGAPGTGVIITINQKELELYDDAKSYYYEMYRNLIPFDVPITIEFGEPYRALTG